MKFDFNQKLKEIREFKVNTTDNALLSMILIELAKLNENIEKLAGQETKSVDKTEQKEEIKTVDKEEKPKTVKK